ncbi:colicin immunity protein [Escherichia coli]|nr:colicin immunity protein [Escherichia coli]
MKRWFKYPVTFDLHYTVSHRLISAPTRFLFLLVVTILNAYDHSIPAPVWSCFNSAFRADKQLLAGILLVLMSVPLFTSADFHIPSNRAYSLSIVRLKFFLNNRSTAGRSSPFFITHCTDNHNLISRN